MTINQALDKMFSLNKKTERSLRMEKKLKELQMELGGRAKLDPSSTVCIVEMVEDDTLEY